MRFFLISDNSDAMNGLRLAGIEGTVARSEADLRQALENAAATLPGTVYYGLLDAAALPVGADWEQAQEIGLLLYDRAQPAPELSVFLLDSADHDWQQDAQGLYERMQAIEDRYKVHCGLQQLFTQADCCAVPGYSADSGYDLLLLAKQQTASYRAASLAAQLAAVLCGQTDRFYATYAGGTALCRARVDVTVQDTTVQLHLRDAAFEALTQTGQNLQALFCAELQQAFAALTAAQSADFFHLQFWHANLYGPRSPAPAPQLTILWE